MNDELQTVVVIFMSFFLFFTEDGLLCKIIAIKFT